MDSEIGLPGNDDGFKFGVFFVCRDRGWLTGMRRLRELSVGNSWLQIFFGIWSGGPRLLLNRHRHRSRRLNKDEWVYCLTGDTPNRFRWTVVFVAIVIAILSVAGYIFAPKGDNQTYLSSLI